MNLNPFELRDNTYSLDELICLTEEGEYELGKTCKEDFERIYGKKWMNCMDSNKDGNLPEQAVSLEPARGYLYLLYGINPDVKWKVVCPVGGYSREIFFIGQSGDKWYFFVTGYGSCSGCDYFKNAMKKYVEDNIIEEPKTDNKNGEKNTLEKLQARIKQQIREFDSLDEFLSWFFSGDRLSADFWGSLVDCMVVHEISDKLNIAVKSQIFPANKDRDSEYIAYTYMRPEQLYNAKYSYKDGVIYEDIYQTYKSKNNNTGCEYLISATSDKKNIFWKYIPDEGMTAVYKGNELLDRFKLKMDENKSWDCFKNTGMYEIHALWRRFLETDGER